VNQRYAGYTQDNFNFFADASDVLRVMLRVLKAQPALQNNPVVLVGASYGALRASLMLQMALDPVAISDAQNPNFVDTALSHELQTHFATVFQNEGDVPLSRARVARQFGWQVLNEPAINYADQYAIQNANPCDPSYVFTQRLAAMGLSCPLSSWSDATAAGIYSNNASMNAAISALMTPTSFAKMLGGVDPTMIPGLSSSTRPGAYRLLFDDSDYPYAPASWTNTQGTIPNYDRYYIDENNRAYGAFEITSPLTRVAGLSFLQNLLDVHTFITRAALDFVIIPEVVPQSLMALNAILPVLSNVSIVDGTPTGTERPGQMVFTYGEVPAFGVRAGTQRTVRFPTYLTASHSVTLYQPAEFYADVSEFLAGVMPATPD
jgi:pimeloyl-ACP methyl ester carboxylesterase